MKSPLNRFEFLWVILIVMIGINMFWTASLIDPIRQIAQNQLFLAKVGITQNERIIDMLQPANSTENATRDIVANIIRDNTTQR
jgi:hypothetical protein